MLETLGQTQLFVTFSIAEQVFSKLILETLGKFNLFVTYFNRTIFLCISSKNLFYIDFSCNFKK